MTILLRLYKLFPKGNTLSLIIIGLLVIAALVVLVPNKTPGLDREGFRQGLDIKGGTHLVYEALPPEGEVVTDSQMEGVISIIRRRVDAFGVSEPIVQRVGDDRIMVQIPGIKDVEQAKSLIGKTAQLDFREQRRKEDGTFVTDPTTGSIIWDPALTTNDTGQLAPVTGEFLLPTSQVLLDPSTNLPQVAFEFNDEGARMFERVTSRLLNQPLGIHLDGDLISSPTVQAVISRNGVITGLSLDEADVLAIQLNAGALPIPIQTIREQDVDATLGAESVSKSLVAGVVGLLLVLGFLMFYYRLPGVLSAGALIIYGMVVLSTFKLLPVTLTLSGIAGFILSIGMAVDANVLIFERLKEELRAGRSLRVGIEAGFNRAWVAIRDSNVSTLITCAILVVVRKQAGDAAGNRVCDHAGHRRGNEHVLGDVRDQEFPQVRRRGPGAGEAWVVRTGQGRGSGGRGFNPRRGLNLVNKRVWYFVISGAVLLPGIVSLIFPPAFNTGIEFSSGSTIEVRFINPSDLSRLTTGAVTSQAVREVLEELGHGEAIVQALEANAFLIRTETLGQGEIDQDGNVGPSDSQLIQQALEQRFGGTSIDRFEVDFVSPIVAAEMVRNAALAVLFAIIGIFLYIAWAFRKMPHFFRYSLSAVFALSHDVLIVLGLFSIMGKVFGIELNTMVITAILAVIGYSINNTIVVFDRIRENMLKRTGEQFEVTVNNSLLETMGRSLNTSLTTLFTLMALALFGGSTLLPFILVLLIGVIAGTYSSMLIGPQILVMWENREFGVILRRVQARLGGARARTPT